MENFNRIKRKTFSFHLEIPQIPPSSLTLIFLPLSIFPVLPPSDLPLLPKHLEALLLPLNIPPHPICYTRGGITIYSPQPVSILVSLRLPHSLTLSFSRSLFYFVLLLLFCSSSFRKQTDQRLTPSPPRGFVHVSQSLVFVDLFPVSCYVRTLLLSSTPKTRLHTNTLDHTQQGQTT